MKFWDTHAHLYMLEYPQQVIERFEEDAIASVICPGIDYESSQHAIALAQQYPGRVWATVGIHPNHSGSEHWPDLERLACERGVVGIGETGLDYYREPFDRAQQIKRFIQHIELAERHGYPLIVHTRSAAADTLAVLKDHVRRAPVVLHSFTEENWVADEALKAGYYLSCSGIATFKNAQRLRDLFQKVPLDALLIETDSPYLAPEPHRGQVNQPKYVVAIARMLASLRGCSLESLAEALERTTLSLFFSHR